MSLMIKTEGLTKDYGGGRGIHQLSLEVKRQTVFGYIGPNGSGKTTTIRLLSGLLTPTSGRAWVGDLEVLPRNHVEIKRMIGYLPDEFGVYQQMSVWEYLDFFGAAFRIPPKQRRTRIEYVLEVTDATHMLDYQVASLSRGMHQKIGIAKTLLHDPYLLILDEPANGLDPYARIEMRNTILRLRDLGKTIMLSSHILSELGAICDEVGILEHGKLLVQGTVRDIMRTLQQDIALEIQVDSDTAKAAELCGRFEGIRNISFSGAQIRCDYRGKRNQIADLNAYLIANGTRVLSLRESEADLESVFLSVTGKKGEKEPPKPAAAKPAKTAKPA